jgi:hypothetical protein
MVPTGRLFAIDDSFEVEISTNAAGAQLYVAKVPFDEALADQSFEFVESFGANVTRNVTLETLNPGMLYVFRLFGGSSGGADGIGDLIDEVNVPRLEAGLRANYLTMCTEGKPQVEISAGGTYVTADVSSGSAVTRALLLVTDADLDLPDEVPSLRGASAANFVVSAATETTEQMHEVNAIDNRTEGWPDSARLGPGLQLRFVALVWDSSGNFDFTWTAARPTANASVPRDVVNTKQRSVALAVTKLVCMYDSDELSDGDGTFTITITPSAPGAAVARTVRWKPMESGSSKAINERFSFTGRETDRITIDVHAVDDDSGSFPPDSNDVADTPTYALSFRRGPGTESYDDIFTLDSNIGGDELHFMVQGSITVVYA